jgi:predicted tellurium resistance membrane protein TerC
LMGRFPAFIYVGVFVLVHAAVSMILHDPTVERLVHTTTIVEVVISLLVTGIIVGLVRLVSRNQASPRSAVPIENP